LTRRLPAALASLVGFAAFGAAGRGEAFTDGVRSLGQPGVVAVVPPLDASGNLALCSGALVGARTVLTSGRCVAPYLAAGTLTTVTVFFGTKLDDGGPKIAIVGGRVHPRYSPLVAGYDVAVVYLASDAPVAPIPLSGEDLGALPASGFPVTAVGFGSVTRNPPGTLNGEGFVVHAGTRALVSNVASGADGACTGDSGGVLLHDAGAGNAIVGVVSRDGIALGPCAVPFGAARIDTVRDFVVPAIDAFEGPCRSDGVCTTSGCRTPDPDCPGNECLAQGRCVPGCAVLDPDCPPSGVFAAFCHADAECQSGACVPAEEDPQVRFCSEACAPAVAVVDCAQHMSCRPLVVGGATVCRWNPTTPGAQGAACNSAADCYLGMCDPVFRLCVEPCSADVPASCPEAMECHASSFGVDVCIPRPPPPGGLCAVRPSAGRDPWGIRGFRLAAVALLLGLAARGRRRGRPRRGR
jgi:trypsin